MGEVLASTVLWDREFERLAWIRISGVPLQLRYNEVFNKIGRSYGKLVWGAYFSWEAGQSRRGMCRSARFGITYSWGSGNLVGRKILLCVGG
ncbi:hypothetical protein Hanom_Chr04g00332811 [Helianthus anomalus]